MNNPNPFVPKGSLLEQQDKRRKHMKIGVYFVLTVSVTGLMVMLIQGCKQKSADQTGDNGMPTPTTNDVAAADTNTPPPDTNPGAVTPPTNIVGGLNPNTTPTPISTVPQPPIPQQVSPPILPPAQPMQPVMDTSGGGEYTVAKGDSLAKIARKNGVSLKALEAANPDVKPTRLKIGQKLVIPAGGKSLAEASPAPGGDQSTETSAEIYIVKSGDTLTKIARTHHVKVKALEAANGLTTTQIKVGKKLKIPGKAEATPAPATVEPAALPDTTTSAPPVPMMPVAPQPSPSAAPVQH
jgi:LysM repeat protein